MSNKSTDLLQHSYAIMVNDDSDYRPLNIADDTILSSDYEPVVLNGQEEDNFDEYENDEVQEIYETDIHIEPSSQTWSNHGIRYLIYCWSQLREQFSNCPEKKKKTIWQNVSQRMVEYGYYFDTFACETKWRDLKKIFMYYKTHTNKKDCSKLKNAWAFYSDMEKAINGIPYEISELKECAEDNCISTIEEYTTANSITVIEKDVDKWTVDSTRELIRLYGKYRNEFSSVHQGGKHLLWEEISKQFMQLGYQYTAIACNDKWRNLKMTFKKNKLRAVKYGEEYVKWHYFKDMDNVFKDTTEETPETSNIITVSLIDESGDREVKKENFNYENNFQTTEINTIKNENNDGEDTTGTETWTEAATKCLIELWGVYRSRFLMAAQGKKRLLWNEISDQLHQSGHNYSGLVCDRKWRLLKANYFKRKEKYKKLGVNCVKWQYYYDLDRILGVPAETITWSMDSTMCLIDCFDQYKEKFMKAANGEKVLIWEKISGEMAQNDFHYSPRACDNKWRTLKNRYNKNKIRMRSSKGNSKVVWVYYNKIDSIFKEIYKNKSPRNNDTSISDLNNQQHENEELDKGNCTQNSKPCCFIKPEVISELKDVFTLRNKEFDQRLKEMDENLDRRSKEFKEFQQQTLEALKRSNELETQKLTLLEQLVSRLPHNS